MVVHMDNQPLPLFEATARLVADRLAAEGRSLLWLSEKTGIPRVTLRRKIVGPARSTSALTLAEVDAIAGALGMTVADLLSPQTAA